MVDIFLKSLLIPIVEEARSKSKTASADRIIESLENLNLQGGREGSPRLSHHKLVFDNKQLNNSTTFPSAPKISQTHFQGNYLRELSVSDAITLPLQAPKHSPSYRSRSPQKYLPPFLLVFWQGRETARSQIVSH